MFDPATITSWGTIAAAVGVVALFVGFNAGRRRVRAVEAERDEAAERLRRAEQLFEEKAKVLSSKRKEENTIANLALCLPQVVRELNRENLDPADIPRLIMSLAEAIFQPSQILFYRTRPPRTRDGKPELHLIEQKGLAEIPEPVKHIAFGQGRIGWVAESRLDRLRDDWSTMSRTDSLSVSTNHPALKLDIVGPMLHTTRHGEEQVLGVLALGGLGLHPKDEKLMFQMVTNLGSLALVNSENIKRLREQANHDGLTGLLTKSYFMHELASLTLEARRRADRLALFIFDIDHFKTYNDTNGHPAGDQLLRNLAGLLKQTMRPGDWVCRYGGEEFMIAMPSTDGDDAFHAAERIRSAIEMHVFEHEEKQPSGDVTISGGVAVFPIDGQSVDELIQHADEALYQSKRAGRNRITRYKGVEIGDIGANTGVDMMPLHRRA